MTGVAIMEGIDSAAVSRPTTTEGVWTEWETPLGRLRAAAADAGVVFCDFCDSPKFEIHWNRLLRCLSSVRWHKGEHPFLTQISTEMSAYLAGTRRQFDVPLAPPGTPFQQEVWHLLLKIPYGETCSYAALAKRMGHARAVRAVAGANAWNPVLVAIPCHRVVAADGTLGGYSAGLERKAQLLALERKFML